MDLLEKIGRLDTAAEIKVVNRVENSTRSGVYLRVRQGLSDWLFFVGEDKQSGETITEVVA